MGRKGKMIYRKPVIHNMTRCEEEKKVLYVERNLLKNVRQKKNTKNHTLLSNLDTSLV